MLSLHEEILQIKWPDPEIRVHGANDAKGLVNSYGVNGGVIGLVGSLECLSGVVNDEHHSVFGANKES